MREILFRGKSLGVGKMEDKQNFVMFTHQLPADQQAEGIAIHWAVMSGKCNACEYITRCCSDSTFRFPADAFCTVKKKEILKEWGMKDGK